MGIITGLFNSTIIDWNAGGGIAGTGYDGFGIFCNFYNQPVTFSAPSPSGVFSLPAGQFPVTLQPGQSFLFKVVFTPASNGGGGSQFITIPASFGIPPRIRLFGDISVNGVSVFPSNVNWVSPVNSGGSQALLGYIIVNTTNATVSVTGIAMGIGTNFTVLGAPLTPFNILASADSAVFSVQFNPTTTGGLNDSLNVTDAGGTFGTEVTGTGIPFQSAFNLTGLTTGAIFAFPGVGAAGPILMLANPHTLDTEEAGSFTKMHDFQQPNVEKQLMRVRGRYEDLGPAIITIMAVTRRVNQPDMVVTQNVNIGTIAADGWVRPFIAELVIMGELIQLTISRAAQGGPVSIIDYMPEFDGASETVKGT